MAHVVSATDISSAAVLTGLDVVLLAATVNSTSTAVVANKKTTVRKMQDPSSLKIIPLLIAIPFITVLTISSAKAARSRTIA